MEETKKRTRRRRYLTIFGHRGCARAYCILIVDKIKRRINKTLLVSERTSLALGEEEEEEYQEGIVNPIL